MKKIGGRLRKKSLPRSKEKMGVLGKTRRRLVHYPLGCLFIQARPSCAFTHYLGLV